MNKEDKTKSKIYNIFISHSWSYGDAYDRLIEFLTERPYFKYKDYSVPRDDPIHDAPSSHELYQAIKNQITPCHVILIMAGKYATYSNWIIKEIKIAQEEFTNRKPILAITPWGSQQISSVVKENAEKIVGWNTESIVNGIREISI